VSSSTTRSRKRSSSVAHVVVGCLVAACLAAGCTSARANLGTTDSSCYLSLPAATKAAGSHSRLLGVHLFTMDDLRAKAPKLYAQVAPHHTTTQRVCVLAFAGHFTTDSVSMPHGRSEGPVAVVVLSNPSNHLLGTVILRQAPLRFAHSHI
jgi:hypothetical protein